MTATLPATTVTGSDFELLARSYEFRDPDAIVAFLHAHPEVIPPLVEAVEVVPRYFGTDTPLALEVERDREAVDHIELFALIQTDLDVDPALASLHRFNYEWWLDVLPTANLLLAFGLEYR